jgi:hypothetical protein
MFPACQGIHMLQKLENFYLAVLRFFVISAAGIMLLAVIGFGISSFVALRPPSTVDKLPEVSDERMKQELLMIEKEDVHAGEPTTEPSRRAATDSVNRKAHERAAGLMAAFVSEHSNGQSALDPQKLEALIRRHAEEYRDEKLERAFATGLADHLEVLLKDEEVIREAESTSPHAVVDRLFQLFVESFDEALKEVRLEQFAQQTAFEARKAEGRMHLYVAGGAFGMFLMIVLLSIAIRVERNLRVLRVRQVSGR